MHETLMDIDLANIKPLLHRISLLLDDGLNDKDLEQLEKFAMGIQDNSKDMVSISVVYQGSNEDLIFAVQKEENSPSIHFFSELETLTSAIDAEYTEMSNELVK